MNVKSMMHMLSVAVATLFAVETANAAELTTAIKVQGMHCVSCARKVTGHLQAVSDAGRVDVNVETGRVTVIPRAQTAPSPRLLWEAVERAGYKPVQLISPYGTFSEKPRS